MSLSKIKKLEEKIIACKRDYYQGSPTLPDHEYDKLEAELRELSPNSPVLDMVGSVATGLSKIVHDTKMLSLNKTYDIEELKKWIDTNEVISMHKFDGVSCSLVYKDGVLSLAKTRGNGTRGENITKKVLWMQGIVKGCDQYKDFEVRGEMYCTENDFYDLSKEMVSIGLERPSSQRNIVAGLIGRKDHISLNHYIQFEAFDIILPSKKIKTEVEKFKILKTLGFKIPNIVLHKSTKKVEEVLKESQLFMSEGDYQIDGTVFSINDLAKQKELGSTSHHPRYKMAFKFEGESKITTIKDIVWQVSRQGILTPIAEVEPVEISGANVSRVTLHNYGVVEQHQLKTGDEIEIIRSGEVIPKFLSVKKSAADKKFTIPSQCPSCGKKVVIESIRLFCHNPECPSRKKEGILSYIRKIGIDDLSTKRLDDMIQSGLVSSIPDLYRLSKPDLLNLDKVQDKLAEKLLKAIERSKNVDFYLFLGSIGIFGGGRSNCNRIVAAGYDTVEKIQSMTVENLNEVEGFAQKSSQDFIGSLKSYLPMIEELVELGFDFAEKEIKDTPFKGKKFCITGSLSRKRSEIEKEIIAIGGSVSSSVSAKTDFLLTNETKPSSSKFKKAISLNIPVITEDDFFNQA